MVHLRVHAFHVCKLLFLLVCGVCHSSMLWSKRNSHVFGNARLINSSCARVCVCVIRDKTMARSIIRYAFSRQVWTLEMIENGRIDRMEKYSSGSKPSI